MTGAEQSFDLREILSFLWRQWKFIAAIVGAEGRVTGASIAAETSIASNASITSNAAVTANASIAFMNRDGEGFTQP